MRAVLCGANGAMGQLIAGILGSEVVGSVSLDGANGVARTFQELGKVEADVEIVEVHHNRKVDAPSGTARMLFEAVKAERPDAIEHDGRSGECKREKNEVGIASLRMGGIVGVHEVHVCTASQEITLRHQVYNRAMLAEGGVQAARFMVGKPKGMYDMTSLLKG